MRTVKNGGSKNQITTPNRKQEKQRERRVSKGRGKSIEELLMLTGLFPHIFVNEMKWDQCQLCGLVIH